MNKPSAPRPRVEIQAHWPDPPFHILLHEPEIPPNTGNIARLCAATGSRLHLIEPLGFRLTDKALLRAGLDYWDAVDVVRHPNLHACLESLPAARLFLLSTSGETSYSKQEFRKGDAFLFGNESRGLPLDLLARHRDRTLNIPQKLDCVRSLNLANCVGIVLYEALRQIRAFDA